MKAAGERISYSALNAAPDGTVVKRVPLDHQGFNLEVVDWPPREYKVGDTVSATEAYELPPGSILRGPAGSALRREDDGYWYSAGSTHRINMETEAFTSYDSDEEGFVILFLAVER